MMALRGLLCAALLAESVFAGLISRHVIEDLRQREVSLFHVYLVFGLNWWGNLVSWLDGLV
jgi:hypothetical protein